MEVGIPLFAGKLRSGELGCRPLRLTVLFLLIQNFIQTTSCVQSVEILSYDFETDSPYFAAVVLALRCNSGFHIRAQFHHT